MRRLLLVVSVLLAVLALLFFGRGTPLLEVAITDSSSFYREPPVTNSQPSHARASVLLVRESRTLGVSAGTYSTRIARFPYEDPVLGLVIHKPARSGVIEVSLAGQSALLGPGESAFWVFAVSTVPWAHVEGQDVLDMLRAGAPLLSVEIANRGWRK
ncbi:MAG: hypothetical protein AB1497_04150 [Bacillota bacterium]